MPRRKRVTGQNERHDGKVGVRGDERDDGGDKKDTEEDTQIISDSDTEEEQKAEDTGPIKVTSRTARRLEREKRTNVQDMTEDEMMDLAVRLSKQEASRTTHRGQVEDDDMKKAIAKSLLQESCSQASETSSKRTRSISNPLQGQETVRSHVRCKLSFSGEDRASGDKALVIQTDTLKGFEEVSQLPMMPELSQRTLLHPSSPNLAHPSVPSAASQEPHSSCLVKQESNAQSSEDEPSQSDSVLVRSPVFLRQCSVRLNQTPVRTGSSQNISHPNSSLERSQDGPQQSNPKSPVFPKTDCKTRIKLTQDTVNDTHSSITGYVCKPEDTSEESSSHKISPKCLRRKLSRKAQPSSPVSVREDDILEAVKLKGEASRGTGLSTVSAPTLDISSPEDTKCLDEFTSHMVLHLSDEDDYDDDENNDKVIPPSPVFPQDRTSRAGQPKLSPTQPCCSSPTAVTTHDSLQTRAASQHESEQTELSRKSADSGLKAEGNGKEDSLISYYWGIPFCPKGQRPDDYTRVILTQLEVYEKSLKEAQRQLLHKADWGLPVFPCPVEKLPGRRLKRHRAPQLLEEDDEEDDDEGRDEEGKEKKKKMERKEKEESQPCSEDRVENGQHETYVILSSPETQEEPGPKPRLRSGQEKSTNVTRPSSCRKSVYHDLSEDTQIQSEPDEHGDEVQNGAYDAESAVCPETQMTEDNTPELMVTSPAQTDVMEVDEVIEPLAEAEEQMEQERPVEEQAWRESVPSQVECPMCTRLFPLSKIEIHAADCDGTVEDQESQDNHSQGSTLRKSVRRPAMDGDVRFENKPEQQEKCFICNKFFTCKEYSHHVDQCLQQKSLAPKQGHRLLSALNRTETVRHDDSGPGPSNTTVRNNRSHADASVMPGDGSDPEALGYNVSSSPIKSFTPISELKDCLINFRQQFSDRTNQKLGRKRKFKR